LVYELTVPEKREAALLELSKKKEVVSDLAPILWYSLQDFFSFKIHHKSI